MDQPATPNYGQITRDTLQAQVDLIGPRAQAEATAAPLYNATSLENMRAMLLGLDTPEQIKTSYYDVPQTSTQLTSYRNVLTGQVITPEYYNQQQNNKGFATNQWTPVTTTATNNVRTPITTTVPGQHQEGLLSIYENQVAPAMSRAQGQANAVQAEQNAALLAEFGPKILAAQRAINPQQTALRDMLYQQAQSELAAGANLTPAEQRQAEQAVRTAQAGRGLGQGESDAFLEAMTVGNAGVQRKRQRQAFAQGMIGLDQSLYGDPFYQLTGRQSGAAAMAGSLFGTAQQQQQLTGPKYTNPESPAAMDVWNTGYNADQAHNIAEANNTAAIYAASIKAIGSMVGSMKGGG